MAKKWLAVLLAMLMMIGCMGVGAGAEGVPQIEGVAALAADSELTWSQASAADASLLFETESVTLEWAEYAQFFQYPVTLMITSSVNEFCLKKPENAWALYEKFLTLVVEWNGKITSEKALSNYLKAIGNLVKPALTKDGKEIFNAYLPCYALARLVEKDGSDILDLWEESPEMQALADEMGLEIWQLDKVASYNSDNIEQLKKYFSCWTIVATRYLKEQGVEFPAMLDQLVVKAENYDAVILKLWGRDVVMKHWYDWILLIVCFGWIWMR